MRVRAILCTAAVVSIAGGLAWTSFGRRHAGRYVVEVPATYLSVGQEFQPRLVSLAPSADGASADVELDLENAAGKTVASEAAELSDGAALEAAPMSLPQPGRYRLVVHGGTATAPDANIALAALPEPAADFGGVTPIASFGVASGIADYLRQHSFAVEPFPAAPAAKGAATVAAAERLILVGDPRGQAGVNLIPAYTRIWSQVASGTGLLLLEPPPLGMANFWPSLGPLTQPSGACDDEFSAAGLADGLPASADGLSQFLRPPFVYDLAGQRSLDLYQWDGARLPRVNPQSGYSGCHSLFTYRYGYGWVTVSTLPLLQHFQDVRARIVLMNLIRAALRRKHSVPPSPGLAWVTNQRLQAMAKLPLAPLATLAAADYRPAPSDSTEPAAVPLPVSTDPGSQNCWTSPPSAQAGATATLDLYQPQPARALNLDFGGDAAHWPQFRLQASPDGSHWQSIAAPAVAAGGRLDIPLPASASGAWRDFRLTLASPAPSGWRLCRFAAVN